VTQSLAWRVIVEIAHNREDASSSAAIRKRTSEPETGEAVVAMRIIDWRG